MSTSARRLERGRRACDTTVDASDCTTCDCDHDGVLRLDAGCAGGPGAAFDCDDTDTYLPHQGFVTDYKWPSKVHADYIYCKDSLILGLACTEDVARREKRVQGCR